MRCEDRLFWLHRVCQTLAVIQGNSLTATFSAIKRSREHAVPFIQPLWTSPGTTCPPFFGIFSHLPWSPKLIPFVVALASVRQA